MYKLGYRSLSRLVGVHPDLVKVVDHAITISEIDFVVLEGMRTPERQKTLVESGASWTMNSRHITGHAVDLGAWVDDRVDWSWPLYAKIAAAMKQAVVPCLTTKVHVPCADWNNSASIAPCSVGIVPSQTMRSLAWPSPSMTLSSGAHLD